MVTLFGFEESIYTRVVQMSLAAKGVGWHLRRENPFETGGGGVHPFGRVPVLEHDGFQIYETAAITRYVDRAFEGPRLTPDAPEALARMDQVIAISDSYAYWPMVRQAYAHGVVRREAGVDWDREQVAAGLQASADVLSVLDEMAREGWVLNGLHLTLAECHLAPMIAAFVELKAGRKMVAEHRALSSWLGWVTASRAFRRGAT